MACMVRDNRRFQDCKHHGGHTAFLTFSKVLLFYFVENLDLVGALWFCFYNTDLSCLSSLKVAEWLHLPLTYSAC